MGYLKNLLTAFTSVVWLVICIVARQCWQLLVSASLTVFVIVTVTLSGIFVIVFAVFGYKTTVHVPGQQTSIDL